MRGREFYLRHTPEDNAQARHLFGRAIELDSQYADGYAALGFVYWQQFYMQWSPTLQTLERAGELAKQALALDDSLSDAHMLLGQIYLWRDREHEQAIAEGEKSIALDPNNADAHVLLGDTLHFVGRGEEALEMVEKAMRLNPYYPAPVLHNLNNAYWQMGRYKEAIAAEKRLLSRNPEFVFAYVGLAASYSALGRDEEARAAAAEVRRLNPQFSLEVVKESWPCKDPADIERALTALRKAELK